MEVHFDIMFYDVSRCLSPCVGGRFVSCLLPEIVIPETVATFDATINKIQHFPVNLLFFLFN